MTILLSPTRNMVDGLISIIIEPITYHSYVHVKATYCPSLSFKLNKLPRALTPSILKTLLDNSLKSSL